MTWYIAPTPLNIKLSFAPVQARFNINLAIERASFFPLALYSGRGLG